MKKLALLLLVALPALAQTQPHPHPLTFDDLASMRRIGAPRVSPDGKWIAYDASLPDVASNSRHSAVFLVPAAGGESKQITDGTKQDEGPAWSPDGKTIAYVSNKDGNPKQVYLYDVAAGTSRKVSDLAGGAGSVKWMPAGDALLVVSDIYPDCGVDPVCIKQKDAAAAAKPSKGRVITSLLYRHWVSWQDPTRSHILYLPLEGGAPRDLTPGAFDAPPFSLGGGDEFDVSPDGTTLVYASNTDPHPEVSTNSDIFLMHINDAATRSTPKQPLRLTTRQGGDTSPKYSPNGRYIAWRSQSRAGYESDLWELWVLDILKNESHRIAPAFDNWIDSFTWAPDSESIYFTAPLHGEEPIYRVTLDGGKVDQLTQVWTADALALSPNGKTIYFDRASFGGPAEIWSYPTAVTGNTQGTPITHVNDALLRSIDMGTWESTSWTGAEGAKVQGFIVKPPGFDRTKKYPAVVLIHGGPQGAWEDAWSYRWNPQMFAARGYVILMPNPRGSTGFGQKFVEEISGDWGGKPYVDIMNGVDMFAALPYVDNTRIGAAGASYGGYMIDWILGHTNRFKALVSHDGVYNLVSEYGATEELWFPEWEFKGNPWDNPELYQKWSPSNYAKNFATPTLVVQGELDFRVPVDQGLALFTTLQRKGVPSELLYFPDEGHWVLKPQNSKLWHQTVLDWLDRWLK